MTAKEILLEQMASCRNQKNWFVPLSDAVAGLNHNQAAEQDKNGNHSVWQLVNHLIFWNERWLMRLRGEVPPEMLIDNSETFSQESLDETQWKQSVRKLDKVLADCENMLKEMPEEILNKEAFAGYGATWYEMFTQFTIHNAYHLGQIVLVRKLLGNWNPEQGVK